LLRASIDHPGPGTHLTREGPASVFQTSTEMMTQPTYDSDASAIRTLAAARPDPMLHAHPQWIDAPARGARQAKGA